MSDKKSEEDKSETNNIGDQSPVDKDQDNKDAENKNKDSVRDNSSEQDGFSFFKNISKKLALFFAVAIPAILFPIFMEYAIPEKFEIVRSCLDFIAYAALIVDVIWFISELAKELYTILAELLKSVGSVFFVGVLLVLVGFFLTAFLKPQTSHLLQITSDWVLKRPS